MIECTISGNISDSYGGGVRCENRSNPLIEGCTFTGNTAIYGGGLSFKNSSPVVKNCLIKWNTGDSNGGGIDCRYNSEPYITGCIITSNHAGLGTFGGYGGGVYCAEDDAEPNIINCIVTGNSSTWYGGGFYINEKAHPKIINCTVSGNSGSIAGGIYVGTEGTVTVRNCIFWGDSSHEMWEEDYDITYSNIEGGYSGEGNIDSDPLFMDADEGDYRIVQTSPCIDSGTSEDAPVIDFEGDPRPWGDGHDMGADECIREGSWLRLLPFSFNMFGEYPELQLENETLFIGSAGTDTVSYEVFSGAQSWLAIDGDLSGSLAPGDSSSIDLIFSISDLVQGIYNDTIKIVSNDTYNPMMSVPVQLSIFSHGIIRVPEHISTIQDAIDHSVEGDTVLVADGTYTGEKNRNIDFHGKAITLLSENGPEATVIGCDYLGRGAVFDDEEGMDSILQGFTFIEGGGSEGGGIYCFYSDPYIAGCVFSKNVAYLGGGIYTEYGFTTIANCTFVDNYAYYGGGAYFHDYGYDYPEIFNCTFSENSANTAGGGIHFIGGSDPLVITNCILWGDSPDEIYSSYELDVTYSDIQGGWEGKGNIDADPLFVAPEEGDFHIKLDSPCIDAGTDAGVYVDIDGDPRPQGHWFELGSDEVFPEGSLVRVDPIYFYVLNILGEQMEDDFLSIISAGSEDLEYTVIPGDEQWLSLNGDLQGVLASGDSVKITLEYDLSGMDRGNYNDTITVTSNDPLLPLIEVPVRLIIFAHGMLHVPGEFATIQAGIDVAADGDTILVADGIYTGIGNKDLDFGGKTITLLSENGPEYTFIDCEDEGRGVYFHQQESSESRLEGFTIMRGYETDDYGGGILCLDSSPAITNCILSENFADYYGGGIYCENSLLTITGCTFINNMAGLGGGLCCRQNSSPVIVDCMFQENHALRWTGGGASCSGTSLIIKNSLFLDNTAVWNGGGLDIGSCDSSAISNSTFVNNSADDGGGINTYSSYTFVNSCIFWENAPDEIYWWGISPEITYSDIKGGWEGEGNIDVYPRFVDPYNYDFRLKETSPCIDTGDPASPTPLGGGCRIDMGAYEYYKGFNCQQEPDSGNLIILD